LVEIKAYIQLIRPYGPIILGLSVVLGEIVALKNVPSILNIVLGFFSFFFLTASSFVFNDYRDVQVDFVNVPDRPIPAGLVTKRSVLLYGIVLFWMGLIFALFLGILSLILALLNFISLTWYNLSGKKKGFIGNVTVAFSVALAFPYGALISTQNLEVSIVMIFLLTFLSNLGREVVKGIADAEGDAKENVRSVAIIYGNKVAALVVSTFFIITAIIGPVILWFFISSSVNVYFLPIIAAEMGFIFSSIIIIRNPDRVTSLRVANQINIWMILTVLTLLLQYLITLV